MDPAVGPGDISRDRRGSGLLLLAILLYSRTPVVVHHSGAAGNPFLFNMGWRAGAVPGFAAFLAVFFPGLFFRRAVWTAVQRRV